MNIVILDDYQDAVRKLQCASKLEPYTVKVFTNTVKGVGQLAVRLRDADILVLIRDRTPISRQLVEKLPRLKLIAQTGRIGNHIDLAACTEHGVAVAEGLGSPIAPAELSWALILTAMRRIPQYVANLKHGAWQQSGLKTASMPPNFGLGVALQGRTLGVWGYGRIGTLVAGYGRAFGMRVMVWGSESLRERARADGHGTFSSKEQLFAESDVLSLHLRLSERTHATISAEHAQGAVRGVRQVDGRLNDATQCRREFQAGGDGDDGLEEALVAIRRHAPHTDSVTSGGVSGRAVKVVLAAVIATAMAAGVDRVADNARKA